MFAKFVEEISDFLIIIAAAIVVLGGALYFFPELFAVLFSDEFKKAVSVIYYLFPFWGPPVLAIALFYIWVGYVRSLFISKQKYVVLEIRLPRDVFKSPLAMELALAGIWTTAMESTWHDVYWLGKVRPWHSLEIVSTEGNIHFYIWTRENYRHVIESQLYSQYPDIEIFEVSDYASAVTAHDIDSGKVSIWAHTYALKMPDPYPIKTYVDYGLDKDPKEEFKVDPLTSVIEFMAAIKKGEHMWMQIIIQGHKKKKNSHKGWFAEWNIYDEAKYEVDELLKKLKEQAPNALREGEDQISYSRFPTRGEAEVIAAIQRQTSKLNFDCGIRFLYLATPGNFSSTRINQSIAVLTPFNTLNLNSFAFSWGTGFDIDWWSDPTGLRREHRRREAIEAYRARGWFHAPFNNHVPFVLSAEELATLFHIPGGVLQVPSVNRIMSKKSEAPVNLPQ